MKALVILSFWLLCWGSCFGFSVDYLPLVFVSGYDPNITSYSLSPNGQWNGLGWSEGPRNPSFLAFHPNGQFVYAVNESDMGTTGSVSAYAVDTTQGRLNFLSIAPSNGQGPAHLSTHVSGKWVFVANYDDGIVAVLPLFSNGKVLPPIFSEKVGVWAHMIISPDPGNFVFVPCKGSDYVAQFILDSTGKLVHNTPFTVSVPSGSGPRHLAFHPSNQFAYLVNELGNTLITLKYDAQKGLLTVIDSVSTLPSDWKGTSAAAEVQISDDGQYVYASNRGHNSIAIFKVNTETGLLTVVGWETGDGAINTPRHFSITPSGQFLLVANQGSNTVLSFEVNKQTGTLQKLDSISTPQQPTFVEVLHSDLYKKPMI